ncbi:hypothetical protein [Streptomyces sp. WMMB 322]|uniref:hypothetical protein n=1 Tax=Streptomyces sp. WMMB 322 TaxID=1286821 RepID=UPI0006E324E0|nr:hypothetical protein [Streptomyces sp. WMMB 322]SCK40771.1 hypothetical protein H180DRAFT_03527 [Streptomyces sp. WMMB 322]
MNGRVDGGLGRAAGVVVLALTVAACGGSGSDGKDSDRKGGASAQSPEQAAPARPVPVEKKQREITWSDREGRSHALRAAPSGLARGSAADFKNVRLEDGLKGKVPYYLTVSYTNESEKRLERPSPERDFAVAAADGQAGEVVSVFGSALSKNSGLPKACSRSAPESLEPGGRATVCRIVMMPENRPPAAVSYTGRDARGDASDPVIWKAGGGGKDELPSGVLPLKKPAESAVEDAEGRTVEVRATPRSIRKGSIADLGRFELDAGDKKKVPYYVTVAYRNDGSRKLLPQMNQKTELRAVSGQPARRMTLIDFGGDGVSQCPEAEPDGLVKPKSSVTECSVFLLPKTDSPAALVFTGEGDSAKTVTWQAPERGK